jgi:hypothetical protein
MNSREAFEAWAKGAKLYGRDMAPGAWDAWQAAERQALERAAQVCDEEAGWAERLTEHEQACGAHKCAYEIRALIDAQSGEEKR